MDSQKELRKIKRERECIVNLVKEQKFTLGQLTDAYKAAGLENEFKKKKDSIRKDKSFAEKLKEFLRNNYPEVLANMTDEEINAYINEENKEQEKRREVHREEHTLKAAMEAYYALQMGDFITQILDDRMESLMERIEILLPDDFEEKLNIAVKSIFDISSDDVVVFEYPYENDIDELMSSVPDEIAQDKEKNGQYMHALEFAKQHLCKGTEQAKQELLAQELDAAHVEAIREKDLLKNKIKSVEDGKYNELYTKSEFTDDLRIVSKEKEKAWQEVLGGKIEVSEETKKGISLMMKKMNEMGLQNYTYSASGEDGTKIYSFNKLVESKRAFEQAVKDRKPEEIIKTQQEYEKTVNDYNELFNIARTHFNQAEGIHPGNLDSVRSSQVPFEFSNDIHTASQVNNVFLALIELNETIKRENAENPVKAEGQAKEEELAKAEDPKKSKIPDEKMDEFLKDIYGTTINNQLKRMEKASFEKVSEGLSLKECVQLLTQTGDHAETSEEFEEVAKGYRVPRIMGMASVLEKNEELQIKNGVIASVLSDNIFNNGIREANIEKYNYFTSNQCKNELSRAAKRETLMNLMLVPDEERKLNNLLAKDPVTDYTGKVIGDPFDTDGYIKKTPVDYAGIMDRAKIVRETMFEAVKENGGLMNIGYPEIIEAEQQLYMKVLMAHPEDADKPEYKNMREKMQESFDRMKGITINENASPKQVLRAEEGKDRTIEMENNVDRLLAENNLLYNIEQRPVEYLTELKDKMLSSEKPEDFKEFVIAWTRIDGRTKEFSKETEEAIEGFNDELLRIENGDLVIGFENFKNIVSAITELYAQDCFDYAKKMNELAEKIRNGEIEVDPKYEDVKENYSASQIIANEILGDNGLSKRIVGESNITTMLGLMNVSYDNNISVYNYEAEQAREKFIRGPKLGEGAALRNKYSSEGLDYTGTLLEFGFDKKGSTEIKIPELHRRLKKDVDGINEYKAEIDNVVNAANEKLAELKKMKWGRLLDSKEFNKMYDAVKAVTKLNADSTPLQIEQTLFDLKYAAQNYVEKKDNQLFTISGHGADRYEFAENLFKEATEMSLSMSMISKKRLSINESVNKQLEKAEQHCEKIAAKYGIKTDNLKKENIKKEEEPVRRKLEADEIKEMLHNDIPKEIKRSKT
ncbi:MAG: hypothetical protein K6F97_05485, partial [Lachnospiraceae bacterium]|nr:hypothetical protein [Lachnospiraceae bacterium]